MPEIRLDVRLLRPGALVAGVAAGRCVLVRAVSEAGGAAPWIAARAAGLPVPEVGEARCGERLVLVVVPAGGQALAPGGREAGAQAAALGAALARHGIAVSRLSAADLHVCDGVLAVRAPVAGPPGEAPGEVAAFVATVAAACATEPVAPVPRRRRLVPLAIAGVAALAVLVTLVPQRDGVAPAQPRAAVVVVPPAALVPLPEPTADPPVTARVRKPPNGPPAAAATTPTRKRKRPKAAPAGTGAALRPRPARPAQRRPAEPPGDDIPVAGGDADPVPAL